MKISSILKNMSNRLNLGITCDMHVHLRDGAMCELVTPTVREGGISVAYVMPNLQPPITSLDRVVKYKETLQKLAPKTTFLMSFYLSKELSPELIHEAASKGAIRGVKCYPAGVTTNSSAGVDPNDFTSFYPIFKAMEENGLVLNLHGEKPSVSKGSEDIHVLNAEESFLPALRKLHHDFPSLKIILEHCTTEAAIKTVNELNNNVQTPQDIKVAATITAHHLYLTIDDWAGNPINFCKPVAKLPSDKRALLEAATSGKPWFFFGSDSAPHPIGNKARHIGVCAGVYTQSLALSYVAQIFEQQDALDNLSKFVSEHALQFYEVHKDNLQSLDEAVIFKSEQIVPEAISNGKDISVAPFMAGQKLDWSVEWQCK
ncbi:probable Dihydroorotase [Zygosaccharomyces bailii ISA1307]|uniref:dihydroorotase n=1 Tax=Zygosaccharomyces bailii (strain CLIB 213 / ATCC 58445 / CBS 680 / BCRC 21525 / NBRC 1098 / NCYC 1416 / NRRL Y-2227) TaxID=1333698 RepID=A0A8J2TAI3_ZYGB2|nr:ZYBA0S11-02608g1_1 [Zygosaccharomyces bailii CLIB 213]CDH17146.1 probable Dihydroorotase [Zygosaccharomyces bailii ISA1307]